MIRFSAALVVAAIGVLIGGVATSSLLLVYLAIGISALALVVLAVGVALKRDELFGDDARSATSGTPERAGESAGLPSTPQEMPSQPVGSHASLASEARGYGSLFSKSDATSRGIVPAAQPRGTDGSTGAASFPGQPGAWPPVEPGFPPAPVTTSEPSSGKPVRSRRPAAPPTRADPVLPWADALPTRVTITPGKSPETVPGSLEDVDDQLSGSSAAGGSTAATTLAADAGTVTDTVILQAQPPAEDVEPEPPGGAPDPADLTDEVVAVPDPEPEALSPVDAGPSGSEALIDEPGIDEPAADDEATESDEAATGRRLSGTERVTVVPGVPRYHVSDCILIRFMDDEDVQRMTAAEAEEEGCTPCSACQPED